MTAVVEVEVGDDPAGWAAAGFAVDGDRAQVGAVRLRFTGGAGGDDGEDRGGIRSWGLDTGPGDPDAPADLDGLATRAIGPTGPPGHHPNRATVLDHVVLFSPDIDRTVTALGGAGLDVRRVRPIPGSDPVRVQVFFRAGEVVVELVGPEEPAGEGPCRFYGLAFTVDDLDATVALLGDHLSAPKAAVQRGRMITTLHHRALGLTVPVAFLSQRAGDGTPRSEARPA
jgi:hypothetical protein